MYFNDQNTQFPLLQTELRKLYCKFTKDLPLFYMDQILEL